MIVIDLDGTLADCEHRRHFVDASKDTDYKWGSPPFQKYSLNHSCNHDFYNKKTGEKWKPDWRSFHEACSEDKPIWPVFDFMFSHDKPHEIWSGRCESVRVKTEQWLCKYMHHSEMPILKMRPIGDNTPDDQLKERWLDEAIAKGETIDFVVDDRPKVVRMWRRRGVFVFDVYQGDKEF